MEDAVAKESVIDWEDDDDDDDDEEEVDEDEPTYCMCEDVSWGVMIACESEDVSMRLLHIPTAFFTAVIVRNRGLSVSPSRTMVIRSSSPPPGG